MNLIDGIMFVSIMTIASAPLTFVLCCIADGGSTTQNSKPKATNSDEIVIDGVKYTSANVDLNHISLNMVEFTSHYKDNTYPIRESKNTSKLNKFNAEKIANTQITPANA